MPAARSKNGAPQLVCRSPSRCSLRARGFGPLLSAPGIVARAPVARDGCSLWVQKTSGGPDASGDGGQSPDGY